MARKAGAIIKTIDATEKLKNKLSIMKATNFLFFCGENLLTLGEIKRELAIRTKEIDIGLGIADELLD